MERNDSTSHDLPMEDYDFTADDSPVETDRLCSECSEIDFDAAFRLTAARTGPYGKPITNLRTTLDRGCQLCSMIDVVLSQGQGASDENQPVPSFHLRACDSLRLLRQTRTKANLASRASMILIVVEGKPTPTISADMYDDALNRGFLFKHDGPTLEAMCEESDHLVRGAAVQELSVNYDLIKDWLRECEAHHLRDHDLPAIDPNGPEFYVIDCAQRRLTRLLNDMEFLALSYVWGKPSSNCNGLEPTSELFASGRGMELPIALPSTIEDAVSATLAMGERYLWVDRYCIPAWSDKHAQIRNMHLIYQRALATIVAVNNDPDCSAYTGLHGVSIPRTRQRTLQLKDSTLILSHPHLSYHLSRSIWATRGWTFQEARLSRRCIFFTEDQAYFTCESMTRSEDMARTRPDTPKVDEFISASLLLLNQVTSSGTFTISNKANPRNSTEILADIEQYSGRTFTYESDALNAFYGVLNVYTSMSLWGVPAAWFRQLSRSETFVLALLWVNLGKTLPSANSFSERRPGYPSWSWLSSRKKVTFLRCKNAAAFDYISISVISQGKRMSMSEHFDSVSKDPGPSEAPTRLHLSDGLTASVQLYWSQSSSRLEVKKDNLKGSWRESQLIFDVFLDDYGLQISREDLELITWTAVRIVHPKDGFVEGPRYWMLVRHNLVCFQRIGLLACNVAGDRYLAEYSATTKRSIRLE